MFTHLLEDSAFASSINCLNFDEAHFIVTSGEKDKQGKIFRAEYSRGFEIRLRLRLDTPCTVFSATMSPQVRQKILTSLKLPSDPSKTCSIFVSTNRPNLCFAVRELCRPLSDLANLHFLVLQPYHPPLARFKKTLIFVHTTTLARKVSKYLRSRMPGIVKCIYAVMSDRYKKRVINDFCSSHGQTSVLVCTSLLSNVSLYSC